MIVLLLITLPILLVASGFFSGSETALFSLSRHQRAQMARGKSITAVTVTTLLAETRALLITLLLGNMTINVVYFVLTTLGAIQLQQAGRIGAVGSTVVGLGALLVIVLFGEVLPKLVAARLTVAWARVSCVPLFVVHRALGPLRWFCQVFIITPLARLIAPKQPPPEIAVDEFESLLTLSQRHGVIDADEERLLQQVLELGQMKVRDLMVPRVDIVAHDLDDGPAKLIEHIRGSGLRHVPVYRDSLDKIEGVVLARQALLRRPKTSEELEPLIRQVRFVPDLQRADQLLVEMRKSATTFAIVVDEYGGTAGLITLEDVVEQMIGDIPGAFSEQTEPEVEQVDRGVWRVGAALPVREWAEVFKRHAPPAASAALRQEMDALNVASTVGGLLMARLGRLPREGDRVTVGNVVLTCEKMAAKRVERVRIEVVGEKKVEGTP